MSEDELRANLGKLVRQLVRESEVDDAVARLLREHLGERAAELPVLIEELPAWDLPNLQLALDSAFARPGWSVEIHGLAGHATHYPGLGLGDLLAGTTWGAGLGSPEYVNAPVGPGRTLPCLAFALLLAASPAGPLAMLVRRGEQQGFGPPTLKVEVVATGDGVAAALLDDLRRLVAEHDVYRGQVLTVKVDPHGGSEIVFLERPSLAADEVVLPDGVLPRIERHVLGPSRHSERLLATGRHLSRGLLLWGAPGTGKTQTVRYLLGVAREATVVILSGGALAMVGAFAGLAKRLAPSLVVLEDVDLVAQERTYGYGPFGSSPVLFELMNEMDGLGDDADVAFVLTTNRPDALEPALAARPGRVDLAVELPLPDEQARRRLFALYGRGLGLEAVHLEPLVQRTSGVTASFVKELLRRAELAAAEAGRGSVREEDLARVLDDLLAETSSLTRVLLGGERRDRLAFPGPHDWLEGVAQLDG